MWRISYEIGLTWMSLDLTHIVVSPLVQGMVWCRQATSHYLNQCGPTPVLPYGVIMPQWVKITKHFQESIYIRSSVNGKPTTNFLYMGPPKSTTAEHLYELSRSVLLDNGLELSRLVGITCDGASNMMGRKGGLTTLYRKECPELFIWHCLCHRLELSFKDAMKSFKIVDKVKQLLTALYYFYRKSPKQQEQLRRVFTELGVNGIFPPRAGGTR